MKRQRWTEGSIVKIDMGDGAWCFGQCLMRPIIGFFDLKVGEPPPIEELVKRKFLFCLPVMLYAITQGMWVKIGKATFDRKSAESLKFFKQDPISGRFYISDNVADVPASYEDIIDLERDAVWDPEHIEDRLRDHFAGRSNIWVESLKPRLS